MSHQRIKLYIVRHMLHVDDMFPEYPDDLLELALLSERASPEIKKKYKMDSAKALEYIGDRCLKIIHGTFSFWSVEPKTSNRFQLMQSTLENNRVFACYMKNLGDLCTLASVDYRAKECADIFEAFIGGVYMLLYPKIGYACLEQIEEWLVKYTPYFRHTVYLRARFPNMMRISDDDFCCSELGICDTYKSPPPRIRSPRSPTRISRPTFKSPRTPSRARSNSQSLFSGKIVLPRIYKHGQVPNSL